MWIAEHSERSGLASAQSGSPRCWAIVAIVAGVPYNWKAIDQVTQMCLEIRTPDTVSIIWIFRYTFRFEDICTELYWILASLGDGNFSGLHWDHP